MKNRFSTMGQTALGVFLTLSAFGMMHSCTDDYTLDTTKPSFLGGSIYDELKARENFKYTLRLIDDLGYAEVLAKTGSKTLFVAADSAYNTFFKTQRVFKTANGDYVSSYEQLSLAQKKRLLNNAMLNNSYVLEMMANCAGGDRNLCLRQQGAGSAVDSVSWVRQFDLPNIQTENNAYDFWGAFRNGEKAGMYIAEDASNFDIPHITHFLEGQMKEKNITHEDVSFVLGMKENDPNYWSNANTENRSYIYNAQVLKSGQDVVCLNGYFHVLDKVLLAPGNMAELIHSNGKTNIFAHILDRFSTPYYNQVITDQYNSLNAEKADAIYERRYLALRGPRGQINRILLNNSGDYTEVSSNFDFLDYDPAWVAYESTANEGREKNMAAMFVPNDEVLASYFLEGAGRVLMDRYATELPYTRENLEYNIDQIPLDIIQKLVKNLMKSSFNETVPSKYLTIMNDARDQMFAVSDGYTNEKAYKQAFDTTMIANNGVVYVMNRVMSPADYASVIAPATYCNNTKVMNAVLRADDKYFDSYGKAPLQQYFSTYLKAMQSRFSFFVPIDEGLATYGYIDPASLNNLRPDNYRYYTFQFDDESNGYKNIKDNDASKWPVLPVSAKAYVYDINAGQRPGVDAAGKSSENINNNERLNTDKGRIKRNLLEEMVNHHIIVHSNDDTKGVTADQRYYLSRNGAPVIIKNNIKEEGMQVNGGLQEQLAGTAAGFTCTVVDVYNQSAEKNGYGNGMTYLLDRPMQASTVSTYKAISKMEDTSIFLTLCEKDPQSLVDQVGLLDAVKEKYANSNDQKTQVDAEALKYFIMLRGSKGGLPFNCPDGDKLVRFFNNYRYTVYVPSNDAMTEEIDERGLPTWDSIEEYLREGILELPAEPEEKEGPEYAEYKRILDNNNEVKTNAIAMINTLLNFLKYHFQDESVFVDNVDVPSHEYMSSAVHNGDYVRVNVVQQPDKIVVKDAAGRNVTVSADHNILARDAHYDVQTATPKRIETSSYVVVHKLDKALYFKPLENGRWSTAWSSNKKAKAFLAKYGTQK